MCLTGLEYLMTAFMQTRTKLLIHEIHLLFDALWNLYTNYSLSEHLFLLRLFIRQADFQFVKDYDILKFITCEPSRIENEPL